MGCRLSLVWELGKQGLGRNHPTLASDTVGWETARLHLILWHPQLSPPSPCGFSPRGLGRGEVIPHCQGSYQSTGYICANQKTSALASSQTQPPGGGWSGLDNSLTHHPLQPGRRKTWQRPQHRETRPAPASAWTRWSGYRTEGGRVQGVEAALRRRRTRSPSLTTTHTPSMG